MSPRCPHKAPNMSPAVSPIARNSPRTCENPLVTGTRGFSLAEDRGFEPLRDCSQLAFQASAIGR